MKLLLISNSTNAGEEYLRYPLPEIGRFLDGVREIVFVPYAAVTFSYADYEKKVQARFAELGIRVRSVHRAKDPAALVRGAEAICVGGGNTFALAKKMQQQGLMTAILRKIKAGTPYVGWSAGSNCRSRKVPDKPPLPRRQPRGARRGDPRTAHPGVYRGQSAPLGGRTARRLHAALRGRETGADRPTPDADVPQRSRNLRGRTGRRPVFFIINRYIVL